MVCNKIISLHSAHCKIWGNKYVYIQYFRLCVVTSDFTDWHLENREIQQQKWYPYLNSSLYVLLTSLRLVYCSIGMITWCMYLVRSLTVVPPSPRNPPCGLSVYHLSTNSPLSNSINGTITLAVEGEEIRQRMIKYDWKTVNFYSSEKKLPIVKFQLFVLDRHILNLDLRTGVF